MSKILILVVMCALAVNIISCSNVDSKADSAGPSKKKSFHGEVDPKTPAVPSTPFADALKKKKLNANSSKTIGEAFDSYKYVTSKEWRETESKDSKVYVDYLCQLDVSKLSSASVKDGVVKRNLVIKFVIQENGEAYIAMATRIEIKSDGKSYITPIKVGDIQKIVTAIYENREITF